MSGNSLDLASPLPLPVIVGGSVILLRSHLYRHLRKVIIPISCLAFYYRYKNLSTTAVGSTSTPSDEMKSILRLILNYIHHSSPQSSPHLSILSEDILGIYFLYKISNSLSTFWSYDPQSLFNLFTDYIFNLIKILPFVKSQINHERENVDKLVDEEMKSKIILMGPKYATLPINGQSSEEILEFLKSLVRKEDLVWENGKVSGAVYHGGREHQELLNAAFGLYSLANPLHPDMWPSSTKLEGEIISMTANLMTTTLKTLCGSTSSGGTESILLATKSHREYFRVQYGITEPEIIACVSAHAAIDKACELFGIRLIKVPMDPLTWKCDLNAVRRAISPNTIMLYGSAPQYPQGVIDDISGLSDIAVQYKIGLHVDCCLGGFILPFAKKLGYKIPGFDPLSHSFPHLPPAFDFDLPGVTSMSVDTHKFGYSLKGISVVLYRTPELRRAQYFCCPKFPGGLYSTPAIAGSRSSGLIAQCWASMIRLGESGYLQHTANILNTVSTIHKGIVSSIPDLEIMGQSEAMIVCFRSTCEETLKTYAIGYKMIKKGWGINLLQHPIGIHLCCTVQTVGHESEFLDDLKEVIKDLKMNGEGHIGGTAAVYGTAAVFPAGPLEEVMKGYQDAIYRV